MNLDDDAQEFYEERAGILEHMAGWPREKAEALARAEAEAYQMAKRNAVAHREAACGRSGGAEC